MNPTEDSSNGPLLPTYDRIPIQFERGEGPYLFDGNGNRYIDALAGIAVNILGYRHPRLVDAAQRAVDGILHVSNLFEIPSQRRLAQLLREQGFAGQSFFCNSGAEAIESAIKFARKYQDRRGSDARTILTFSNSFHGRTLGALAATGQKKYREGFGPLPGGFDYLTFNQPGELVEHVSEDVAGVIVEPVQGEGGIVPATEEFLSACRKQCDAHDALLVMDEVQSGMCRSGSFFAFQELGVQPDIVALAKGIANGFPMGCILAHESLEAGFLPGDHASTFGGNPFVTEMACEVLRVIDQEEIARNVRVRSEQLRSALEELSTGFELVESVRGLGLMMGIPVRQPLDATEIMHVAREHGLVVGTAGTNVIRLVPPLIITEENVTEIVHKLEDTINDTIEE